MRLAQHLHGCEPGDVESLSPVRYSGGTQSVVLRSHRALIKNRLLFVCSQQVTPEESGIYTCVCKHLENVSLTARSVQLEIKREWQDVWVNDYTVIL